MSEELQNNLPQNVTQVEKTVVLPEKSKNNNSLIYLIIIFILLAIIGFLSFKYVFGEKIMSSFLSATPTPQVVSTPTVVSDPTANWKTYKNEKYGFEFKYPNNYLLNDSEFIVKIENDLIGFNKNGIDLRKDIYKDKGQVPRIYLQIVESTKKTKDYIAEVNKSLGKDAIAIKELKINSILTTKIDREMISATPNQKWTTYLFENDGLLYILTANYGTEDTQDIGNTEEPRIILDQILSTFKFTKTDETANWKTYKNEKLGFSIKIPNNETVEEINGATLIKSLNLTINNSPPAIGDPRFRKEVKRQNVSLANGTILQLVLLSLGNSSIEKDGLSNKDEITVEKNPNFTPRIYFRAEILDSQSENDFNLISQILSTFKFL